MTKSEVLKNLAGQLDMTQADTEKMYDSFVEGLTVLLSKNKGFTLPGLGSFHSEIRPAHISYNPHYEQKMKIPPKKAVYFSQSSTVKSEINEGQND